MKTIQELENIAIEILNLLAEKEVPIGEVDKVFEVADSIMKLETKVKKIEI